MQRRLLICGSVKPNRAASSSTASKENDGKVLHLNLLHATFSPVQARGCLRLLLGKGFGLLLTLEESAHVDKPGIHNIHNKLGG